jgi:hypothetical protein
MGRSVLAVLSGAILWAVLWIGTGAGIAAVAPEAVAPGQFIDSVAVLLTFLSASVAYSIAAGYVTGTLAKTSVVHHGLVLGILQVVLGIGFQAQSWRLMPLWYHLTFLTLLLPGNVYGAWLVANRRMGPVVPA